MVYDPSVAANILSGIALLVALASYRLARKTARDASEASQPDVHTTISNVKSKPGWLFVYLKVTNHFPNDLEISEVRILLPLRAVGLTQQQASTNRLTGEQNLLSEMPLHLAKRRVALGIKLAPAGKGGVRPIHNQDTGWFGVYVKAQPSFICSRLRFGVVFLLRKTDVRRFKRIVIPQSIKLPSRQID
jgi:hypothetical protein